MIVNIKNPELYVRVRREQILSVQMHNLSILEDTESMNLKDITSYYFV